MGFRLKPGRKALAAITAGLLSGCLMPHAATANPARPNIIVILADDLGYADNNIYNGGRFVTPNIDRLAKSGVIFTDGYASAPVCAPSRAGLLTGRYQERFGFEYNNGPAKRDLANGLGLPTSEITIAQLLKDDGYHTGAIGKWHEGTGEQFYPMNRGFEEFVGFLPGESSYIDPRQPGVHMSLGPYGDEAVRKALDEASSDKTIDTSADDDLGRKEIRLSHAFIRGPLNQIVEGADHHVVDNETEYLTDFFGDRAVDYIRRNAKAGTPYFLYLAFNAVHSPHMVTAKYYDRFPQIHDHQLRVYMAMLSALDDQVGRVMAAVRASGQAGNTIIVFASDNGCAEYFPGLCSCTPLRGGKLSHYEGGVRIPFVMSWPDRFKPDTIYRQPVSLLDVVPTAVAAAGGKLPTDRVYDGVNLLPYLSGKKSGAPHDDLFWRRQPLISMRQGDWVLWESNDASGPYGSYKLLFNLHDDLNETKNLAAEHPGQVKEMEDQMNAWSKGMADPLWPSKGHPSFDVCGKKFTLPV